MGAKQQRHLLERLRSDNAVLKEDLLNESRFSLAAAPMSGVREIARLQDQADTLTRKIEIEKRRVLEMDRQINDVQAKIDEQRKKMGGVNASKEATQHIQRQIRMLENRLEKAYVKYNEAMAHNRALKEQIDSLRKERLVFDSVYRKLQKELGDKKAEMEQILERSTAAAEAREAIVQEMAVLKGQADREQAQFEQQWRELGQRIDSDRKTKEALKSKMESQANAGIASAAQSVGDRGKDVTGRGKALDDEDDPSRKLSRAQWGVAGKKAGQADSAEKLKAYVEAFQRIQQITGIHDVDDLVEAFSAAEEENFALFNQVRQLNGEIERVEDQISDLKAEIERFRGQGASVDSQRKKILQDLEGRLQRAEARSAAYDHKLDASQRTIDFLKTGILNVFTKLGCRVDEAQSDMFGEGNVTDSNLMHYLGIIEQKMNELLQSYLSKMGPEGALILQTVMTPGPQFPASVAVNVAEPPSILSDNEDGDDADGDLPDDMPLTRDMLESKVQSALLRRTLKGPGNSKVLDAYAAGPSASASGGRVSNPAVSGKLPGDRSSSSYGSGFFPPPISTGPAGSGGAGGAAAAHGTVPQASVQSQSPGPVGARAQSNQRAARF